MFKIQHRLVWYSLLYSHLSSWQFDINVICFRVLYIFLHMQCMHAALL